MAEALFTSWLAKQGQQEEWRVASAGVEAYPGIPATQKARMVMAERGIDMESHRSQAVSPELLESCSMVLVMEEWHQRRLQLAHPSHARKIHPIRRLAGLKGAVEDPVGLSLTAYRQTADELQMLLERIFQNRVLPDPGG